MKRITGGERTEIPHFPQCVLRMYVCIKSQQDKIYTNRTATAFSRFIEPFSRSDLTGFVDVSQSVSWSLLQYGER